MKDALILKNRLKEARTEKKLSQSALAQLVGVSRNTISSIETGQFNHANQTRRSILPLDACAHADEYPIQNA